MRDYNTIPFRRPRKSAATPLVETAETRKIDQTSTSTAGTSSATPERASPLPRSIPSQASKLLPQSMLKQPSPVRRTNNNAAAQTPTNIPSPAPANNNNNNNTAASRDVLNATDALAVRRDGPEATIARLRNALEESASREASEKANLAKSDAAIVELKSNVRTLRRQLERNTGNAPTPNTLPGDASDERVGELQVQLDRAHAQILTADMIRKELEDTLEAETYTWELRTQDQERQIAALQQECATVSADLENVQSQWKDAEEELNQKVGDLQTHLDQTLQELSHYKAGSPKESNWQSRAIALEREREELQGCLDEALKELEAVDAELQTGGTNQLALENERLTRMLQERDGTLLEPLQHLYRFLLERDGLENTNPSPQTEPELLAAIQSHLDREPPLDRSVAEIRHQVGQLESQISVYKGDLQAREERNAELRSSLKEAVSLLKPLQDAASKADREKQKLRNEIDELKRNGSDSSRDQLRSLKRQLDNKDDEMEELKNEVQMLEIQLSKAKLATASSLAIPRSTPEPSQSVSKIRARRAAEQETLQNLLKDTRSRFSALDEQNDGALQTARDHLRFDDRATATDVGMGVQHAQEALRDEMETLKSELSRKEAELRIVQNDLEQAKSQADGDDLSRLEEAEGHVEELQSRVETLQDELKMKRKAERELNRSLKEALNLLRPLQQHLQEAENEKKQLTQQLASLKRQLNSGSASPGDKRVQALQVAIDQLEKENSQLHDALEDMSQSFNVSHVSGNSMNKNDGRLREEIVELKSRYEVTQGRLEDAFHENQSLVGALRARDQETNSMEQEIAELRARLGKATTESAYDRNGGQFDQEISRRAIPYRHT